VSAEESKNSSEIGLWQLIVDREVLDPTEAQEMDAVRGVEMEI
jgi:hypothetical protein